MLYVVSIRFSNSAADISKYSAVNQAGALLRVEPGVLGSGKPGGVFGVIDLGEVLGVVGADFEGVDFGSVFGVEDPLLEVGGLHFWVMLVLGWVMEAKAVESVLLICFVMKGKVLFTTWVEEDILLFILSWVM